MRDGGGRVDEKRHLVGLAKLGDLGDRLPRGDLVIGRLERGHGDTWLAELGGEGVRVDPSERVDGDFVRSTGCCGRMEYCGVLNRRVHDTVAHTAPGCRHSE